VGSLQQRGRAFGMIRLDDSLAELVRAGRITEEVALRTAESKTELAAALNPAAAAAAAAPSHKTSQGFQKISSMFRKVDDR
jgi:twitching motility protein PilT